MTRDDLVAIGLALVGPLVTLKALGWLVHWCLRLLGRATQERRSVQVDANGVAYGGRRLEVAELASVKIVTTAEGPFVPDVFWILDTRDGAKLVIPQEAPRFDGLLARLQTLPRFDNDAVLRAMACTDAGEFRCWRSQAEP